MYFYLMFLLLQYTNLCYSSVNSLKKRNFKWERKLIFSQAAWVFFSYFITDRHILKEAHYLSKWYHNEYKQHMICYSAIQSSIYPNNFSVEKKLQKWCMFIWRVSIRHDYFFKDKPHYLFHKTFWSHKEIKSYPSIHIIWSNKKQITFLYPWVGLNLIYE